MKKLLQLCLAALLAAGSQAHAAYIDQSRLVDMSSTLSAGGSFAFSRTIETAGGSLGEDLNGFSDRYAFRLDAASTVTGLMTSVPYDDDTGLSITGFDLYREGVSEAVYHGTLRDPFDQTWLFKGTNALAAGKYFLEVNGFATYTNASYGGTLSVSPVPEPGTLALMLGGLAVLGVALRRR